MRNCINSIKGLLCATVGCLALCVGAADETTDSFAEGLYTGAAARMILPGNNTSAGRGAAVALTLGRRMTDAFALEAEGLYAPNAHEALFGGAIRGLYSLTGFTFYDRLFGAERFEPFLTGGVRGYLGADHVFADDAHRSAIGPEAGCGFFYHLTDQVSLRVDGLAACGIDCPAVMMYQVGCGLQYEF